MNEPTIRKMREMGLMGMADAFKAQLDNPGIYESMPFDDRFAMVVDAEVDKRKTNKYNRLLKSAKLRFPDASPEGFIYDGGRKIDKASIARLLECRFIDEKRDVLVTGPTGVGKTWLACAAGKAACRKYKTVRYIRLSELFAELALARETGRYTRAIAKFAKYNLLILDDWLLYKCSRDEQRDVYELIEAREQYNPTMLCSQFTEESWLARIGNAASSEGVIARLTRIDSVRIRFDGDSDMRAHRSLLMAEAKV